MALLAHGVAVALQVHLRLRQHVLVAIEGPLRLQKRRAVRAGIDIHQRIALLHPLPFREMDGHHQPIHLAGDRRGVDRRHRADGIEVLANVSLFRCRRGNRDGRGRRCGFLRSVLVMAKEQQHANAKNQHEQSQHHDARRLARGVRGLMAGSVRSGLRLGSNCGNLVLHVSGQAQSPFRLQLNHGVLRVTPQLPEFKAIRRSRASAHALATCEAASRVGRPPRKYAIVTANLEGYYRKLCKNMRVKISPRSRK